MDDHESEKCPICGGFLAEESTPIEITYGEQTICLCSRECLTVFEQFPEAYAGVYEPELRLLEDTTP